MKYADKIHEDVDFLQRAEKAQSNAINRDRIRFLKLLKTGRANTQSAAGEAIGLGQRHAQRLWHTYQQGGFQALMVKPTRHSLGKLSSVQISHLRQFLFDDQAQRLEDIQAYLAGSLGVEYTIGGVSALCKRLKIKQKTGRPVNVRQRPGAIAFFKKI
ncbi:helix-turn-helix domain-containing protein [Spirosoma utsteinense]|uniref:Transposase n=1 Tax=Spirosoma utsteinense TaxID=2585773 RepID=A0ABR6WFS3_9BACT|nr:winged helix-turn-helix domain-containing protein [Spirosoma utsteinense]MBC3789492.1 transposase [Spirosoma utsteinense]MBC3795395.1 transposase [Spirosoma utsteinense]